MTLTRKDLDEVARELEASYDPALATSYRSRWNLAPTDRHVILVGQPGRHLEPATWGFARKRLLINARAESAAWKDAFREAFARRRCVVPADGFYEWSGEGAARRPHWFHRSDGRLLWLAGLYEEEAAQGSPASESRAPWRFTLLTTSANQLLATIHDRMPVILSPGDAATWLAAPASGLLRPAPEGWLVAQPASRRVNAVRNDDPACLVAEAQGEAGTDGRDRTQDGNEAQDADAGNAANATNAAHADASATRRPHQLRLF